MIAIMNIVHIVFKVPQTHGSGGDLRNRAIRAGLARRGRQNTCGHPDDQSSPGWRGIISAQRWP